jgi:hypothetical protein
MYRVKKVSGNIYVFGVSILPLSTIFGLDFGQLSFLKSVLISYRYMYVVPTVTVDEYMFISK